MPKSSLDKNLNAHYNFSIEDILRVSWQKVSGFKATMWGALAIFFLSSLVLIILTQSIYYCIQFLTDDPRLLSITVFLLKLLHSLILVPMAVGLFFLGVKRMQDHPIQAKMVLDYYPKILKIDAVFILGLLIIFALNQISAYLAILTTTPDMTFFLRIIFLVLAIVGILAAFYLFFAYLFSTFLIADKEIGILQALELSRRAVTHHWFKIFFLSIIISFILFISILPVFPLIWSLPLTYCIWGQLYLTMFSKEK